MQLIEKVFVEAGPLATLALLRELDIIGDRKRGIRGLYPVSRSEWRQGVREGRYPAPVKVPGRHLTFWKESDVLTMLQRIAEGSP